MTPRLAIEVAGDFMNSAPVDLEGMAAALGIDVHYDPMSSSSSGKIERTEDGYRITVNERDSERRQRFTLAHEIAHYLLHRDMIGDGITDNVMYRSRLSNEVEQQANRFAAHLLMPTALMRKLWHEGVRDFQGMASRFNVSAEAASIRMRDLFPT